MFLCCFSDFSNKPNVSAIQYDVITLSIQACYSEPSCSKLDYINPILKPFKPLTRSSKRIFTRFWSLGFNQTIISCKALIAWWGPLRAAKFKPHLLSNPGFMLIALTSLTEFIPRLYGSQLVGLRPASWGSYLFSSFESFGYLNIISVNWHFALLWCGFVNVILNWSENNIVGGNKRHKRLCIPLLCKSSFILRESPVVLKLWLKRLCCYFRPSSFIILYIKRARSVFAMEKDTFSKVLFTDCGFMSRVQNCEQYSRICD